MKSSWINQALTRASQKYQKLTWRQRALPDFIIIGAQKSGTSSLFHYLSQHPQLHKPITKEIHFFDGGLNPDEDDYAKGEAWYRLHFPLRKKMKNHDKTYDSSPFYLFNPLVPERIFGLIPDVKLIAILRNPAERAISQYFHEQKRNREPLSIFDALKIEEKRLETAIKEKDYKNPVFINYSYKLRGHYKTQLERYLNYFSREKLFIIKSEDLFQQPDYTMSKIFGFIGVERKYKVQDLEPRNVASDKMSVDPAVYEYLNKYFYPHNQSLYKLLGENFGW